MKKSVNLMLAAVSLFIWIDASAQYTGPGSAAREYTVKEILDQASQLDKSDADVKVRGYVIEQVTKDTYWFKDATGKVLVEIDKDVLPLTPFNENTEVVLLGEVDYDLLEGVEIEIEQISFTGKQPVK